MKPPKLDRARLLGLFTVTMLLTAWLPAAYVHFERLQMAGPPGRALVVFQNFAPLVATLFCTAVLPRREDTASSLGLRVDLNRFWLVAWFAPIFVTLVSLASAPLFGETPLLTSEALRASQRALGPREGDFIGPLQLLLMAIPAGLTLNAIPALAAEVGFRGFLYREMPGGPVARALRIGALEATMLLPVTLLGWGIVAHRAEGVALMVVRTTLVAVIALVLRTRCESVVPVALFRATSVALVQPSFDLLPGASELVRPPYGLTGCIGLATLLVLLVVHDRFFAARKLLFPAVRVGAART